MENQRLSQFSLFKGISDQDLDQMKDLMEFCSLPADMVLFEQDQRADYLYILLEGEVGILYKPYDGPPSIIARIFPGNVFGWSAALQRKLYSSTALTTQASKVYRIKNRNLTNLCDRCPSTARLFLDRLAQVVFNQADASHEQLQSLLRTKMDINYECEEGI